MNEGTCAGNVYHCTSDFGGDVVGQHALTWTRIVQHEQEVKTVVDAAYVQSLVTEAWPGNNNWNDAVQCSLGPPQCIARARGGARPVRVTDGRTHTPATLPRSWDILWKLQRNTLPTSSIFKRAYRLHM